MAESIEAEPTETIEKVGAEPAKIVQVTTEVTTVQEPVTDHVEVGVIWTPGFIVVFALMLIIGLSADSLLVQARDNGYLPGNGILTVHVILIFVTWVAIIAWARSAWTRLGGIFGCIWAIFLTLNLVITAYPVNPNAPILAHLNAAYSSALLGCYICLSMERVPLRRWDAWFFSIAPFVAVCFVLALFLLTPAADRSFSTIEDAIVGIANILSFLVWWARPSCWETEPGVTFLFGVAPLTILLLSIPGLANGDTNFFFSELLLLSILLGAIRFLQGELRWKALHAC
ncbi:MAG TPA: hypothetical protein VKV40_12730 [Ktedonobacteraceae bacterium]|nr:hypothetical protein [Ktedonobacteraceae bacterium]